MTFQLTRPRGTRLKGGSKMAIAAFVLSIISLVLLIALTVIFLWVGAEVTKQDTIEKATREYLEQKDKTHND